MKYDKQKAFPYPVLIEYCDDYIDGDFQTIADFAVEKDTVSAEITYHLSVDEIHDQIRSGNAAFVTIVTCRETYYRHVMITHSNKDSKSFSVNDLRGEVKTDSYVVVQKHINNFTSPDINAEFGRGPFKFQPGNILAQTEPQIFYLEREMFNPVSSVFELVKKEELPDEQWSLFFDCDNVQIEVGSRMKKLLDNARNTKRNQVILINSLYFSAVMQSIEAIKENDGYDDRKWAEVIKKKAHNIGCDIENGDSYVIAQQLMRHPLILFDTYDIFNGGDQ